MLEIEALKQAVARLYERGYHITCVISGFGTSEDNSCIVMKGIQEGSNQEEILLNHIHHLLADWKNEKMGYYPGDVDGN